MGLLLFLAVAAACLGVVLAWPASLEVSLTLPGPPRYTARWLGRGFSCPGAPFALALADLRRLPRGGAKGRGSRTSPAMVVRLVRLWIRTLSRLTHKSRGNRFSLRASGGVGDAAATGLVFGSLDSAYHLMGARLGVRPDISLRPGFAAPSLGLSACAAARVRLVDVLWSLAAGFLGR